MRNCEQVLPDGGLFADVPHEGQQDVPALGREGDGRQRGFAAASVVQDQLRFRPDRLAGRIEPEFGAGRDPGRALRIQQTSQGSPLLARKSLHPEEVMCGRVGVQDLIFPVDDQAVGRGLGQGPVPFVPLQAGN